MHHSTFRRHLKTYLFATSYKKNIIIIIIINVRLITPDNEYRQNLSQEAFNLHTLKLSVKFSFQLYILLDSLDYTKNSARLTDQHGAKLF